MTAEPHPELLCDSWNIKKNIDEIVKNLDSYNKIGVRGIVVDWTDYDINGGAKVIMELQHGKVTDYRVDTKGDIKIDEQFQYDRSKCDIVNGACVNMDCNVTNPKPMRFGSCPDALRKKGYIL